MVIYPSDNHLVLSCTSCCKFLLHDKLAPMNNLLQLVTLFSSEDFINSGGFSKFKDKLGAKNLIVLQIGGISVLIAMRITISPFRANISWMKTLLQTTGQKVGWITWAFAALMADLGCVLYCAGATQHKKWDYPTKTIVPALREPCHGNRVGNFLEGTAVPSSLPGPDWLHALYQQPLSQAFGSLSLARLCLGDTVKDLKH